MSNENQINLNARDLYIKILDDDVEVINLRGGTAFDKGFIEECKSKGVREETVKEDNNDKEDTTDTSEEEEDK